jgi:hypothetical protein
MVDLRKTGEVEVPRFQVILNPTADAVLGTLTTYEQWEAMKTEPFSQMIPKS